MSSSKNECGAFNKYSLFSCENIFFLFYVFYGLELVATSPRMLLSWRPITNTETELLNAINKNYTI